LITIGTRRLQTQSWRPIFECLVYLRYYEDRPLLAIDISTLTVESDQVGVLFAAMTCVGTLGQRYFGCIGFLTFSLLGGLVSSASTTATAAALTANGSVPQEIAAAAAVITSVASALVTILVVYRLNQCSALGSLVVASTLTAFLGLILLALTDHKLTGFPLH